MPVLLDHMGCLMGHKGHVVHTLAFSQKNMVLMGKGFGMDGAGGFMNPVIRVDLYMM